jgi:hypothetical protein
MFNFTITAPVSLFVGLAALTGVTLHDTKIDKLATTFAGIPAMMSSTEGAGKSLATDQHTHVERVSLNDVKSTQPRLATRNDHRKHVVQRSTPKGTNAFDGYSLPMA